MAKGCSFLHITLLIGTLLFQSSGAKANEPKRYIPDDIEWQLDIGLALSYGQTLIEGMYRNDRQLALSLLLSGGVYVDDFFIESSPLSQHPLTLGYVVHADNKQQVNLIAESWFSTIDAEEQYDTQVLDGLDARNASLEVGVEYLTTIGKMDLRVRLLHDALGRHGGGLFSAELARQYYTRHALWMPSLGITVVSSDAVDFYYGVRPHEATLTRPVYTGSTAWIGSARLYAERPLGEDWSLIGFAGYAFFSDGIADSPIVGDRNDTFRVGMGVLWSF
ncbi:MipA/OmpV family protein [Aestuariibacter halophilus]|uniref:MipA/OmpV family protein n=1 Tax=Fluctibacter halophilus TaxID=226011 RepID=A0ABS8G307_9ALTE|nr:MipA/OmpV family protein [Aestuariibacter halophilus]MCC2614982.1 MipA/OmpV family protein [Aestuariibacter halophilus]